MQPRPDTFAFQDPTDGPDTLLNQNLLPLIGFTNDDVILVSADGFGGDLTPGVLPSEQFTVGNSASDPNHRFILHKPLLGLGDDVLYYDPDGDGTNLRFPFSFSGI